MAATIHPRRSILYMPGSNSRALEKAKTLAADGLILDLEDAVAPNAKTEARQHVIAATRAGLYGKREVLIRVNALNTPWGYEDLAASARSGCNGVLLPKVQSADYVRLCEQVLEANDAPENMQLWCMMETPFGMLHADEIANATARLGGMVMGTSDLTKDLQAAHTRERLPMITSLSLCVLAARAHGLAIVDGVHLDLDDSDGFLLSCQQGRALGFDGKTLIHPKTITMANQMFGPSPQEVAFSRRIIEAFAEAERKGKGVVVVDGKLVENLHMDNAQRLVQLADSIAALEQSLEVSQAA
ncbi:L-malyl-CoA/beta-methylmalyl-CoA lyase [invertebrate metagenome]|uniref:L-malyl-CoA/beta-methylmalyl-CoA lyase n=1 Tax=invertebrate metagenome TaxID=1711999 RepID=A0A484HCG9_9ZZZZ